MNEMHKQMSYNSSLELKTRVSMLKRKELSYSPKNMNAADCFTHRIEKKIPNRVTYLKLSNDRQLIEKLLNILSSFKGVQSTQCVSYKSSPQSAFILVSWNVDINFMKEYETLKAVPFCQIVSAKVATEENSESDAEELAEFHPPKVRRL